MASNDDDSEDGVEETEEAERERLLFKRDELVSMLRSVRKSLYADEKPIIEEQPFLGANPKSSGLYAKATRSFTDRGLEAIRRLYSNFSNSEGRMGYFEFRAYLELVGRPEELDLHIISSNEAWRCYMHDLYEVDMYGNLTPEGFVRYREAVESKHPLEVDLLRAGLPCLPQRLVDWKRHTAAFDLLASENVTAQELHVLAQLGQVHVPKVPVAQLQLLCLLSGEVLPAPLCEAAAVRHQRFVILMSEVREYFAKHHRFAEHQTSKTDSKDRGNLYRDSVAAWWFSDRPRSVLRSVERALIASRLRFARFVRRGQALFETASEMLKGLTDRSLLVPAVIARVKNEVGRYSATLEVGESEENLDDGVAANLRLGRVDSPARSFAQMGLPTGIGSALCVDLLSRPDIPERTLNEAMNRINELLQESLVPSLRTLGLFQSAKVFPWTHETDEVPVLRIALCFKSNSNVDLLLKKYELGLRFAEILPEVSVGVQLSSTLSDILESSKFVLGQDLRVYANGSVVLARQILATVAEELLYACEEKESQERVERSERKWNYRTALQRTKNFMREARLGAPPNAKEFSVTGFVQGERHSTDAEIAASSRAARAMRGVMWFAISFVSATKAASTEFRFPSLADMLLGNDWLKSMLPASLNREVLFEPGAASFEWKKMLGGLESNLRLHRQRISNFEKAREIWREQAEQAQIERLKKMSKKERAALAFAEEKQALARKLKALGIDSRVDDFEPTEDDITENPVEFEREMAWQRVASEKVVLEAYDSAWRACFAVHGVTAQSGVHRFALGFQGLDVFDLLPEPESSP